MDLKKAIRHEPRGFVAEWAVTIIVLLFGIGVIAQPFVIPTASMNDTLLVGDHILVDKIVYAPHGGVSQLLLPYCPVKRGDIIVFRYPIDISQTFVKRAIGIPGDRIRIQDKHVYLNGRKLNEPYTHYRSDSIMPYRDNFPAPTDLPIFEQARTMLKNNVVEGELVVPPDNYFAMGDNRDDSLDSRFWGFVPAQNVIGKPLLVWWSYDAPTDQLVGGALNPDHLVDLALHFFTKTRWRRSFQLVRGHTLE